VLLKYSLFASGLDSISIFWMLPGGASCETQAIGFLVGAGGYKVNTHTDLDENVWTRKRKLKCGGLKFWGTTLFLACWSTGPTCQSCIHVLEAILSGTQYGTRLRTSAWSPAAFTLAVLAASTAHAFVLQFLPGSRSIEKLQRIRSSLRF
jgi:hypothetical protein